MTQSSDLGEPNKLSSFMLVKTLLTTALLGSARRGSPKLEFSDKFSFLENLEGEPESRLLDASAALLLYQRAGYCPASDPPYPPLPANHESLICCSKRFAELLETVLSSNYRPMLLEAVGLLANAQKRMPFSLIPEVLDIGITHKSLRGQIAVVVGERGKWLAPQNPQWSYISAAPLSSSSSLDAVDIEDVWSSLGSDERIQLLHELRVTRPDIARALVAAVWKDEITAFRIQMIRLMEHGLSDEDEMFLDAALNDRSGEVRKVALSLLSRLPNSALARRAKEEATKLLTFKKRMIGGLELIVTAPDSFDPEWSKFGIESKSWIQDIGDKAWWLLQWVALVPPDHWTKTTNESPDALLRLARHSDWSTVLRIAWTKAASLSSNPEWKYAVLKYWALERDGRTSLAAFLPNINSIPGHADDLIIELLDSNMEPIYDEHPALFLLQHYVRPWSLNLSRKYVRSVQRRIIKNEDKTKRCWQTMDLLKTVGLRMPPVYADELTNGWPDNVEYWNEWKSYYDEFNRILNFRHELHKEINT
jgi:hypothetical protein